MSRPGFAEGALIALALAVAGAIGAATLPMVLGASVGPRVLVTTVAAAYIAYLLHRSRERSGRVVVTFIWLAVTVAGWALLPFIGFLLLQIGLIWLIRALYFHGGVLAALVDLALCAFAFAAAVWALGTGSWLLALWCFFLVQALFGWIPAPASESPDAPESGNDRFEQARELAEAALKRLAASR